MTTADDLPAHGPAPSPATPEPAVPEPAVPEPASRWAARLTRRRLRTEVAVVVGLCLLGFAAFLGTWPLTGGHWYVVRTPSMGAAAPVGTLLWVEPVAYRDIHVGEIIAFHPSGAGNLVYTHRVSSIEADGALRTKGDINTAADPWQLQASNVIGTVTMRWWAVGWLVRAAPVLIIGGLLFGLLIRRFLSRQWRLPAGVVAAALVISIAIYLYRPLTRADLMSFTHTDNGAKATYVSTGLLPMRLSAAGGAHRNLHSAGNIASVTATKLDPAGRLVVHVAPHIGLWWWIGLLLICFLPAFLTLAVGVRPEQPSAHAAAG